MSRLVAASACEIACIPAALWEEILYKNAVIMQRYVRFLTERIAFLNRKICYLTAGSTEQKLATYLSHTLPKDGTYVPLPLPAANLADLLDIGRASLYRAINKLTEDGFISHRGKEYALCQTFSSNDANSQQKNPPATE
jgi:CRP-like cAMP-binding protein